MDTTPPLPPMTEIKETSPPGQASPPPPRPDKVPLGTEGRRDRVSSDEEHYTRSPQKPHPGTTATTGVHSADLASLDLDIQGGDGHESQESIDEINLIDLQHQESMMEGRNKDDELWHLVKENRQLRGHLAEESKRSERTERHFVQMRRQFEKHIESSAQSHSAVEANLIDQIANLKLETRRLETELEDARSHIFSLQSYRKDVTPDEVGQDFDELFDGISSFAEKLLSPLLDDESEREDFYRYIKKNPAQVEPFKKQMAGHYDLHRATHLEDTDVDVVVSLIFHFLQQRIFNTVVYRMDHMAPQLQFLEKSMKEYVKPPRDHFAIRSWRAEFCEALLVTPEFSNYRRGVAKDTSEGLTRILNVFARKVPPESICEAVLEQIVQPAMRLYEKIQLSTHHYYLDMTIYGTLNQSNRSFIVTEDFYDDMHKTDCIDLLRNRKKFNLEKENPSPAELHAKMEYLFTLYPALVMRQYGQGDSIREGVVVRKQGNLVAWGSQEARAALRIEKTLLLTVIHTKDRERTQIRMPFGV